MISSSPTQQQPPPTQTAPSPQPTQTPSEVKKVTATPVKRRAGQTLIARLIKAIFRPILKCLYYTIRWIRTHKLVTLIATLLLIASILATSYFVTGNLPFAKTSSSDTMAQQINQNHQLSPDVRAWLIGLKNGDLNTMIQVEKSINPSTRPPDTALYVLEFSEPQARVKWTNASISSMATAADGLQDTYVEVDMNQPPAADGSSGGHTVALWHFGTQAGRIIFLDFVSARTSQ